jgi:hypothetical protein
MERRTLRDKKRPESSLKNAFSAVRMMLLRKAKIKLPDQKRY